MGKDILNRHEFAPSLLLLRVIALRFTAVRFFLSSDGSLLSIDSLLSTAVHFFAIIRWVGCCSNCRLLDQLLGPSPSTGPASNPPAYN
jgi:hypothetical protein